MPALLLHPRDLEQNRPVYLEHFRVRFWSLYAGNRLLVPVKSVHVKMESWSLNGGLRLAQIVKVILAVNPQRGIQHKKITQYYLLSLFLIYGDTANVA